MGEEKTRFDIDGKWLSNESNRYLNRYEDNLEEQSEKIAEDKGIENEKPLDEYLSNMNLLFNEYIVDGALLQCPKATTEVRSIKYDGEVIVSEFKEDASKNRIHIFEERTESINGLIPVTVEDCKGGLRDDTGEGINITSFGNCDFLYDGENVNQLLQERVGVREPALEEVKEALVKGKGTCYCFMDLEKKWENMPSDVMGQIGGNFNLGCLNVGVAKTLDTSGYFKFDGKEGINRMSMLFCRLGGGCIMALESGQDCNSLEERIQALIDMVDGLPVNTSSELFELCTMEILSRLIYQESRNADDKGQNAVLFSIVNRLFSDTNFLRGTRSNNIHSIITGANQYESVLKESNKNPNSFCPPIAEPEINLKGETDAWENAKRLAAILYVAIEVYGNANESGTGRNENVVEKGDEDTRQQVVEFIEQQEDITGEKIINEIGTRDSFRASGDCDEEGALEIGGNTFFWDN